MKLKNCMNFLDAIVKRMRFVFRAIFRVSFCALIFGFGFLALIANTAHAQAADPVNGKTLYDSSGCGSSNCHGSPPDSRAKRGANKPDVISQAFFNIQQMNVYRGTFTTKEVGDLAAYLAAPIAPPGPAAQSIALAAIATQPLIQGGTVLGAATATSGLPVAVASSTPAVCTLNGNNIIFWLGGTCSITANQAGGTVGTINYAAAPQVIRSFVISLPAVAIASSKRGNIDIEGLGKSTVVVRSVVGQSAQTQVGRFAAGSLTFTPLVDPGVDFRLIGATDFDGNGKSDLAFQNTTTLDANGRSNVLSWNDFLKSNERSLRVVKPVWDVQAVGDLDGDGLGDLVWRYIAQDPRDTGVSYIWFTNPPINGVAQDPQVRKRGGAPLDWTLLGAADINFDNAADMIYISPAGQIRTLMGTASRTCANLLVSNVPTGYKALKFADFTGGRRGDVLFRNDTTGEVQVMSLSAAGYTLPPFTADPNDPNAPCTPTTLVVNTIMRPMPLTDATWKFYASADLDGDGILDIVWLKPDGNLAAWLMNGNGAAPTLLQNIGAAPAGFTVFQP